MVVETLTVTECMRLCEDEEACVSVAYHIDTNECRLHTQHVHKLTLTVNDYTGWRSFDHYCFQGDCLSV